MSVDVLLARQGGLVSRDQALAAGLSRGAVDHLVRVRRWRPLHPRVYLAAGHPHDAAARVRAALLWAGEGAVLDGPAAAWWWGLLDAPPSVVGITVPGPRSGRPSVALRRRDLPAADVVRRRGVTVTGLARTVLDTAVDLGADGPAFLDRALRERVPLAALVAAHRRGGGPGSATAGRLLAARTGPVAPLSAARTGTPPQVPIRAGTST